jgi:hypothetical protein
LAHGFFHAFRFMAVGVVEAERPPVHQCPVLRIHHIIRRPQVSQLVRRLKLSYWSTPMLYPIFATENELEEQFPQFNRIDNGLAPAIGTLAAVAAHCDSGDYYRAEANRLCFVLLKKCFDLKLAAEISQTEAIDALWNGETNIEVFLQDQDQEAVAALKTFAEQYVYGHYQTNGEPDCVAEYFYDSFKAHLPQVRRIDVNHVLSTVGA